MKEKTKVYIYTRVSTAVQVDGYSLDAQKSRMKAYAEFNDFEIVGEYEDAGKSGKSIEGRLEFNRMMEDIKSGKDGVSYVLVFKLSRFGRNAADVLSTLQVMQDFDVNLICVEDGIDSSKDAGKLMISVLSAVAEIERENIRVQTMEGRIQKAREGKWNGGFAPYGYKLEKGMLYINEEEAEAIRIIFDQYVHTDIGANGLAKYLANHGINKIQRQNGKNPLFDAALIRRILKNPVYCGKIAYGRRRTEKVHGTRNDYRLVEQENYLLVDGLHEAIVSEGLWHEAQVKLLAQAKKYEKVNNGKDNKVHLLTGLLKCPICGAGMYGNKSIKHKPDGTKYKDFFYYGCKHRTMTRGHKCEYKKQINEELLDGAVAEVIIKLVSNPKFAAMMQQKINMKIDTSAIEQEIANYEKQLRQSYATKSRLIDEIDTLDPDDKHYIKRKADLDDRLYKMYDKIEDTENLLIEARAKKMAIEAEKLTADNIYKVLIYFEKLYAVMDEQEKRQIMESLISEIHIYEERQPNGQWLKSIKFKLPIIEEDMEMSLDSDTHVEIVKVVLRLGAQLLQLIGERGGKVALVVLPLLPAGDVGFYAEYLALYLTHGLTGGNRQDVDGENEPARNAGEVGDHIVSDVAAKGFEEQNAAELISHLKIAVVKTQPVRADQIAEIHALADKRRQIKGKQRLLAGAKEVMENTQAVLIGHLPRAGVQPPEALREGGIHAPKVSTALVDPALWDRYGDILFLHEIISRADLIREYFIVLRTVAIQRVAACPHQHRPLKISGIQTVVDNGDLRRGICRQCVQNALVRAEDRLPILVGCSGIIHIGNAPRLAVPRSNLPHAAVIETPDGNGLLDAARNEELISFAALGRRQRFNQNRHAPLAPTGHNSNSRQQSRAFRRRGVPT